VPTPLAIQLRETQRAMVAARVPLERRTLTLMNGACAGQVFVLSGPAHVFGRSDAADLRVDDPDVSRTHARFVRDLEGRYVIEDLGSTNGTFVGGRRVDRLELTPGDRIQCGPTVLLRYSITDDLEQELHARMFESATRDHLTSAHNRRHLLERLGAEIAHATRHRSAMSLLLFDVDGLKTVNDVHGHPVGDVLLRAVAGRVARMIRTEDVFGRYGGDEFAVVARSTPLAAAIVFAERLASAVRTLEIPVDDGALHPTISCGVAALSECPSASAGAELLALADARLYRAKAEGRDRVCGTLR
jgi:diguanylate cyclase (GGDEF)-like protein